MVGAQQEQGSRLYCYLDEGTDSFIWMPTEHDSQRGEPVGYGTWPAGEDALPDGFVVNLNHDLSGRLIKTLRELQAIVDGQHFAFTTIGLIADGNDETSRSGITQEELSLAKKEGGEDGQKDLVFL